MKNLKYINEIRNINIGEIFTFENYNWMKTNNNQIISEYIDSVEIFKIFQKITKNQQLNNRMVEISDSSEILEYPDDTLQRQIMNLFGADDILFAPYMESNTSVNLEKLLLFHIGGIGQKILVISNEINKYKNLFEILGFNVDIVDLNQNKDIRSEVYNTEYDFIFSDYYGNLLLKDFHNIRGYKIFYAAQNIKKILCSDIESPLSTGFDIVYGIDGRNLPGKIIYAVKNKEEKYWKILKNIHINSGPINLYEGYCLKIKL